MAATLGMTVRLTHGILYARFDDLDLDASSHWGRQRQKKISVELFRKLSKQQAGYNGRQNVYVTLTLQTFIWLDHLVFVFSILH